jgi:uncharacterized tellurite resistance protein B-like protein
LILNMTRKELTLAKVLAGAAWADGEIAAAERDWIAGASRELGLTTDEIAEVERILANPLGVAETESLACDFLSAASPREREDLMRRLEGLFKIDAELHETERGLLSSLRAWETETPDAPSLLSRMRMLVAKARPAAAAPSSTFEKITSRVRVSRTPEKLTPQQHERAVLFGAILYRTAFADGRVDEMELSQLRGLLTAGFNLEEAETGQILSVIRARAAEDMDRQRLCASFNRIATMDERFRLLGCLFAVAKADGRIDEDELREIRLVANYLWIDARSFNDVRLREV